MSITNGYATLAELKERLMDMWTYTASTISISNTNKTITDSAYGLKRFETSDNVNNLIKVTIGTASSVYTVSAATAQTITVSESPTTQAEGTAVTIQKWGQDFADSIMEGIITATSRWIDEYTGRRFYLVTETRYFDADSSTQAGIDDLVTLTTLKTDYDGDGTYENTWAADDYYLWPYNAAKDGHPYTEVHMANNGDYYFPDNIRKGIEIAGSWGYSTSAPAAIKEACLLQSARWYMRKDAPFGVTGPNNMGTQVVIDKFDSDVKWLLRPFRRLV